MTASLIVAAAANEVIGRGGALPWHLPADLRRFRALTTGPAVVMGRLTHESTVGRRGTRSTSPGSMRRSAATAACPMTGWLALSWPRVRTRPTPAAGQDTRSSATGGSRRDPVLLRQRPDGRPAGGDAPPRRRGHLPVLP